MVTAPRDEQREIGLPGTLMCRAAQRPDESQHPDQKRTNVATNGSTSRRTWPRRARNRATGRRPLQSDRRCAHEEQPGRHVPGVGDDSQEPEEDALEGGRADARSQAARARTFRS